MRQRIKRRRERWRRSTSSGYRKLIYRSVYKIFHLDVSPNSFLSFSVVSFFYVVFCLLVRVPFLRHCFFVIVGVGVILVIVVVHFLHHHLICLLFSHIFPILLSPLVSIILLVYFSFRLLFPHVSFGFLDVCVCVVFFFSS